MKSIVDRVLPRWVSTNLKWIPVAAAFGITFSVTFGFVT